MQSLHRVSIVVHGTVCIQAPPGVVWAVLGRLELRPAWRRDITRLDPPRHIVWRLTARGANGLHTTRCEALGDGRIRVRATLALDGWRMRLLRGLQQRRLRGVLDEWLAMLKGRAESFAFDRGRSPLHRSRWNR